MADEKRFEIPLLETGADEDEASFRLQNAPEGEMQRQQILQQDASNLSLQVEIISVIHGTYTPDGPAATVVVTEFRFQGSRTHGRRFREAVLDMQFSLRDTKVGGVKDPEVVNIAPFGSFSRGASTKTIGTTASANVSGTAGPFGELGVGWERTSSVEKVAYTTLHGSKRIEGRYHGAQNTARWRLAENSNDKNGIPSVLRVAVLVKPKTEESFQASFGVDVKSDPLHSTISSLRRFRGKSIVDPMYFAEEEERYPLNPEFFGKVDLEDLSALDLQKLEAVGPNVSARLDAPV